MPTCGISQILESNESRQVINQIDGHPPFALYEVFCVFKESGLNAEYTCQANVEKLIKLYVNR